MADVELFENDSSFLQGGGHKELGGHPDFSGAHRP